MTIRQISGFRMKKLKKIKIKIKVETKRTIPGREWEQ